MFGAGKAWHGRRYTYAQEHYECVLCGREHRDEADAVTCFDGHSDTTRDLADVLHHLFCHGKHCRPGYRCFNSNHCHYKTHTFADEDRREAAEARATYWRKVALRMKRSARTHGMSAIEFIKLPYCTDT